MNIEDSDIINSGSIMKHPVESVRLEHSQSRLDVLLSVLGTGISLFLDPNRQRNALIDTNAIYLTTGPSSLDFLASDIERNSVWKKMK